MKTPFGDRLAIYGYMNREVIFNDVMIKLWNRDYKSRFLNIEQLLFEPLAALKYCEDLRMLTSIWLPHNEILQNLMNLRKKKLL